MQRLRLIGGIRQSQALIAVVVACLMAHVAVAAESAAKEKPVIPLIVMDEVPLLDAIRNLAAQAEINYIIAPEVMSTATRPTVSARWENLAAVEALTKLLAERHLACIQNPETTVSVITGTNSLGRSANSNLLTGDTNAAVPVIALDEVPLDDAIKNLTRMADFAFVTLDSSFTGAHRANLPMVSYRWTNLKPRQALVALLDTYNLEAITSRVGDETAITIRPIPRTAPAPREREPTVDKRR